MCRLWSRATIPELHAVLVGKQLTVAECDTSQKKTRHLWIITAFLMNSPTASAWGPIIAAIPGLGLNFQRTAAATGYNPAPCAASTYATKWQCCTHILRPANHSSIQESCWGRVMGAGSVSAGYSDADIAERICCGDVTREQLVR